MIWRKGDPIPASWPLWLRLADIEWCDVTVSPDGKVHWHDGAINNAWSTPDKKYTKKP